MTQDDDDDLMTPEEIAQYEQETFERVVENIYSTIWIYTRNDDDDGLDVDSMRKRIIEAITVAGAEKFFEQREADAAAVEAERTRKDTAVVRKPNDIGATWHRVLTEQSTVCGKPIPENAATGNIGDADVYRTFLCGACMKAGDNLFHARRQRREKETRKALRDF